MFEAYLVTNAVNGKQYVGITTRAVPVRWSQHLVQSRTKPKGRLAHAIRKYGDNSFVVEHIASATTRENLFFLEQVLIKQYDTFSAGYNGTLGGDGGNGHKHSPEVRKRISESKKGWNPSAETRARMSAGCKGKKRSAEARAILSAAKKAYYAANDEHLRKITALRVRNAARDRAEGKTGKRIYDEALREEAIRAGTKPVRSIESRLRMRQARLAFLDANSAAPALSGKITATDAAEIKWLLANTSLKQGEIAARYGIGNTQVSNIRTGRVWRRVIAREPQQAA